MGLYVNPTATTKEDWLAENLRGSVFISAAEYWLPRYNSYREAGLVPVVLVDNGAFTALAVAYSQAEAEDFGREDGRTKLFAVVPRWALADDASGVGEGALVGFGI